MHELIVAVSGINAVDNPGPGIGVVRSLKEDRELRVKAIGLAYDAMEPGIYLDWLVDRSFIMPYPSSEEEDYLARLFYIQEATGLEVVVPTLDAELPLFIKGEEALSVRGLKTFLPTWEQFELRSKERLLELAPELGRSLVILISGLHIESLVDGGEDGEPQGQRDEDEMKHRGYGKLET
jgi:carbamoyl-phosphate synthase large subunit